ncbi:CshA/CshB family fibrillar adhesin-related protein [Cellulomonas sp. S1-8]|uniref:CshA/CshB family fibrillar adhesin-related protein n=1 Tax=Cellulomonas sp. S1-8 TaxID=2904790 RepID=UPI0022443C43|nr:CshA/CshB family fibrillar adhesin-related protein [Cellulomonas sp. S1-8]UZN02239.1 CshA/CshB family fibrillar adhesin-related protein [Cellulomonas sp. S1-8]
MGTRRAALGAALALVLGLGLAPVVGVLTVTPAAAATGDLSSTASGSALMATDGAGRYKDRITWVNWGAAGASLTGGTRSWNWFSWEYTDAVTSVTTRQEVSANARLEVTCRMTRGYEQNVVVYRPGTYAADGLPQLYRASGAPGLVSGFAIPGDNADRTVNVACSAVLATYPTGFNGTPTTQPVPLAGLVVADAESTNATETLAATGVAGTTWRIIDRWAGTCGSEYRGAVTNSSRTLTLSSNMECGGTGASSATAVALAQGSTSLDIALNGSGIAAASIGYVLGADYGDAPASYGHAPAVVQPTWTGGSSVSTSTAAPTNLLAGGFELATMAASTTRLGLQAHPNRTVPTSADATGDAGWAVPNGTTGATTQTADEDTVTTPPRLTAQVGVASTYSLPVSCAAATTGRVRGWLDWNANNGFDAGEATATAACTAGTATLTWTGITVTSAQLGRRTLRVAIAPDDAQLLTATTPILTGEVEDWQVEVVAALTVTKTASAATMPAGGNVTFTITVANAGAAAVVAHLADDYALALDDATLGTVARPAGSTFADNGTGRFTWSGTVPAGGSVQLTYPMTTRSAVGGPGDQVLTNVVAVSTSAITAAVTCAAGSAEMTALQCARVDLYRPGLAIDKQAYLASDTGFTAQLANGVQLAPGAAVVWRYVVTNTGSVPLTGVVVSDAWSQTRSTIDGTTSAGGATTLTCPGFPPGTSVALGTLAVGAATTCTASGAVVPNP